MHEMAMRFLVDNYYSLMKALSLLIIISLIINLKEIAAVLKKIDTRTAILLLLITASGFILRMWIIPHTTHVYFDEFVHINIASNLAFNGKFCEILMGGNRFLQQYSFPTWPAGYHSILAMVFSVFGDSCFVAYNLSALFGSLSIPLIFLVALLLFNNQKLALYTAFLFNLIPVHMKYSGGASLEIPSLFFILFTYLCALLYARQVTIKTLFLLITSSIFTFYMRPENGLLLLFIPFFILLFAEKDKYNKNKVLYHTLFALLLLPLAIPYFLHIYLGLFTHIYKQWDATLFERISRFSKQATDNIFSFWFSNFTPLSFTLLAIFGFIRLLKADRKIAIFFSIWFITFTLLYSQHLTASFINNPDGDRFSLLPYLTLIIFAGFGLFKVVDLFKINKILLSLILIYLFIDIFSPLAKSLNRTFPREVYKEHEFVLKNKDRIPEDTYVVTFVPSFIVSAIHRKAVFPELFIRLEDKPRSAILLKDFFWVSSQDQNAVEIYHKEIQKELSRLYDFKLISQYFISKKNQCSLILLTKKEDR